jgi:replicative DNA helicase
VRERTAAPGEITILHDAVAECQLLTAALVSADMRKILVSKFTPEHFFEPKHKVIWAALCEVERRKLAFDLPTLQSVGKDVDVQYCRDIVALNPVPPVNIDHYADRMYWDYARLTAANGAIKQLVMAVNDPNSEVGRVKALAKQVGESFNDYHEKLHFRDCLDLMREIRSGVEEARAGKAIYAFGIQRLDTYEDGKPRMIPGLAPGLMTAITGSSGHGKSILTAMIVLAQARLKRKVLYGAWEMNSARTLQLLGCMSCGFDRSRLKMKDGEGGLTEEELELLMVRCKAISKYVTFMDTAFSRKKGEKASNERNMDILQTHIEKSGAAVVALDLFKRCLVQTKVDEEEQAIARAQAMALELQVHMILVQQQRLKDVEKRPDQRPTREGIKGSAMWVEAPDNILGVFNPSKVKDIVDNTFEIVVLKQRDGVWPMAVEFDYDPATTILTNGRTVPYNLGGSEGSIDDFFVAEKRKGKRR